MSMLPWIYSSARPNGTVSMKSESHWIASRTAPKRQQTFYFEFVVREIHNAKCGGDPEIKSCE